MKEKFSIFNINQPATQKVIDQIDAEVVLKFDRIYPLLSEINDLTIKINSNNYKKRDPVRAAAETMTNKITKSIAIFFDNGNKEEFVNNATLAVNEADKIIKENTESKEITRLEKIIDDIANLLLNLFSSQSKPFSFFAKPNPVKDEMNELKTLVQFGK
ncbi:MAG: hypothetical protein QM652_07630 [Legionella sp.]|uniref:hypothetical protein n=1 Tax=Legionella sp. TaxID=459 RepID=UPI0039E2DCA2